jgi:hypothetical protein
MRGISERQIVEDTRRGERVLAVENLMGAPEWKFVETNAPGLFSVGVVNNTTGETTLISEPGVVSQSAYHSHFDAATRSLDRAVNEASYMDSMQALASGLASLEAYINGQIETWNAVHPNNRLVDEQPFKSLDQKVQEWFPLMMGGAQYDRGKADWSKLKQLMRIRHDEAIHPKASYFVVPADDIVDIVNGFRLGIATTLFRFHQHFNQLVPSSIIRAKHAPDAILI